MEVTGKDILNLVCAFKMIKTTTYRNGYCVFASDVQSDMDSALKEAIDKYREQLKN